MPIEIDPKEIGLTSEFIEELEKEGVFVRLPEHFYKYYIINDNFLNSISQSYLWLSRPSDFNDPFDARLLLDTANSIEDIDKYISEVFKNSHLKEAARDIYTGLKKDNPELFTGFVNAYPLSYLDQIGITCFTKKCDNLLMWAHYADNHRGVSVKFDLLEDDALSDMLYPVSYSKDYPKINWIEVHKNGNFEELFLTKSIDWNYEEEWRIVQTKHLVDPGEDEPEFKNYGTLPFQKNIIKEVVFGCKASDTDITTVINTFKASGYSSVIFKKAEMIDFKFGLSFHDFETI